MATKKPVRAPRSAPARALAQAKPAAAPPAPIPWGTVALLYRGGADLSFRDASGRKRRILRGLPFMVDAATAELLLRTDPAIILAALEPENRGNSAPISPVPAVAAEEARLAEEAAAVPVPHSTPVLVQEGAAAVPASSTAGAIVLGDLPESGKLRV
jgi:hypothetical protein